MLHYIRQKPHLQEFLELAFLFSDEAAGGSTPQSMGARGLSGDLLIPRPSSSLSQGL